jgi:hypothetical protein
MLDLETSAMDVEQSLSIRRRWVAKKMDVERKLARVARGRSKESAASVQAVGTGSSSPASLHHHITRSLRQYPASPNVDLALVMDILDSHHGLAQPLFLISSTDDVSAFSSSSSSLNEKPYVTLRLSLFKSSKLIDRLYSPADCTFRRRTSKIRELDWLSSSPFPFSLSSPMSSSGPLSALTSDLVGV